MQGQRVTENIYLCPDGVYHWAYEYKLMRDPTILITLFKVVILSVGISIALMLIINLFISLFTWGFDPESFFSVAFGFVVVLPLVLLLSLIGYSHVLSFFQISGKMTILLTVRYISIRGRCIDDE
ncbi:MAG: hypothetical protein J6X60_12495 [Ruminiclostridium sp.]|nr:hypothetical protein [Ruminiclostridium sp.]